MWGSLTCPLGGKGEVDMMECYKFGRDFHVPIRMYFNAFGDCLMFHVASSSGQSFYVSNTLVHDQIPSKLIRLPRASAVLCFN